MLETPNLVQIECETADDIVLRWELGDGHTIEYVQVKTIEGDSKWSIKELTARGDGKKGTSICERSLNCDRHGENASFRLVTTRDVRADLRPFLTPRSKRTSDDEAFEKCAGRFATRYKESKSPSGRSLADWARSLLWEVEADEKALQARNLNHLLALANAQGVSPGLEVAKGIYRRLVDKMIAMAEAPAIAHADKCWDRADALTWWQGEMAAVQAANTAHLKVYRVTTEQFFSEISSIEEGELRRALFAYDVEYDGDNRRRDELIDHLLQWLPEIALPSSLLATYDHLAARKLPKDALRHLEARSAIDVAQLISTLMLHAILRHHFDAEPIACKLFFQVAGTLRSTNAHVVQSLSGDQLWLGRSRLVTASEHREVVSGVLHELRSAVTRDILKAEREIIVQLREPQHLRNDTLNEILASNAKIADLLSVLRLPILVAYDSTTLGEGYSDEYLDLLRSEVIAEYEVLKADLGVELDAFDVAIFLVPVECAHTLSSEFNLKLRR